jgi:TATA-binding protein-associated factor Taf7
MISEKALKAAAAEVNQLVDTPIDLKAGVKKITAGLKEAIADVLFDSDEFTKETEKVLKELGWKKAEEEDEEEETEDAEEETDDEEEEEEEAEETEEEDDDEEEKEEKQKTAEKIHQKNIVSKGVIVKEDTGKKETAGKEKRKPPTRKTGSYTRIDAVCDALKTKKPKTVKDWIKATNEVYISKGGSANDSESAMMIKYASKTLSHFDIAFPAE